MSSGGLKVWEGAIDLCDFIDSSPDEVVCIDKTVLEVGLLRNNHCLFQKITNLFGHNFLVVDWLWCRSSGGSGLTERRQISSSPGLCKHFITASLYMF